jgi:hypothetical protein
MDEKIDERACKSSRVHWGSSSGCWCLVVLTQKPLTSLAFMECEDFFTECNKHVSTAYET